MKKILFSSLGLALLMLFLGTKTPADAATDYSSLSNVGCSIGFGEGTITNCTDEAVQNDDNDYIHTTGLDGQMDFAGYAPTATFSGTLNYIDIWASVNPSTSGGQLALCAYDGLGYKCGTTNSTVVLSSGQQYVYLELDLTAAGFTQDASCFQSSTCFVRLVYTSAFSGTTYDVNTYRIAFLSSSSFGSSFTNSQTPQCDPLDLVCNIDAGLAYLFVPSQTVDTTDFESIHDTMLSRAPFAYAEALLSTNTDITPVASDAATSLSFDFSNITGVPIPTEYQHMSYTDNGYVRDNIYAPFRPYEVIVLWLILFMYLVFLMRSIFTT